MNLAFIQILGFDSRATNIGIQKRNNSLLRIYKIDLTSFSLKNSPARVRFFEKIILFENNNKQIVPQMPSLFLRNVDRNFGIKELN